MAPLLEVVKETTPFATPFIPLIIDIFIKPRLEKFAQRNKGVTVLSLTKTFEEYLARSYAKHSYISILVFQNQQQKLEDIYIPLSVTRQTNTGTQTILIDSYRKTFLPKFERILIRDTAGMGKSTLMKKLFLSCLEKGDEGIPIFLELRKLDAGDSIIDVILRDLNEINDEFDEQLVLNLIREGGFVFFLDGYDEIARADRGKVTQMLQEFISKTGNNLFIMTSRPEPALVSFASFIEFEIKRLDIEEAFSLLRRYDQKGGIAESIIAKLSGKMLESVRDFLTNPLLVSLLYKSYEYKQTIPIKKNIFYRQVYDALFESHDLTKDGWSARKKYSELDIDNFHAVLRALGFITIRYGVEFDKDQILAFLKKARELNSAINFNPSAFLSDLLQTVPLFSQDGNYYTWSHKSLQDYFAAQYIWLDLGSQRSRTLKSMLRSEDYPRYENVFVLYADMDYKNFRQTVLLDALRDFLRHCDEPINIQAADEITVKEIQKLKQVTFGASTFFFPKDLSHELGFPEGREDIQGGVVPYITNRGFNLKGKELTAQVMLLSGECFVRFVDVDEFRSRMIGGESFVSLSTIYGVDLASGTEGTNQHSHFYGISANLVVCDSKISVKELLSDRLFQMFQAPEVPNPTKCKALIVEIEREIQRDESDDLLDNW